MKPSQEKAFKILRCAIEDAVGRKIKTPRDFDFLAEAISEKVHNRVSVSTLKRFWGYVPGYDSMRISTLDLLSQFVDYDDWDDFLCKEQAAYEGDEMAGSDGANGATGTAGTAGLAGATGLAGMAGAKGIIAVVLAIVVVGCVYMFFKFSDGEVGRTDGEMSHLVIRRGQIFETCSDYLRLFGITSTENCWDLPLPHHDGIIIWGPEYHHRQWHNDGVRDSLLPTITEWWEPEDSLLDGGQRELLMSERNKHLYFTVMRTNELRITFMKNLTDTNYVFLGVYRTNLEQSDSTRVVWERVADECDLNHLSYLEQLRH